MQTHTQTVTETSDIYLSIYLSICEYRRAPAARLLALRTLPVKELRDKMLSMVLASDTLTVSKNIKHIKLKSNLRILVYARSIFLEHPRLQMGSFNTLVHSSLPLHFINRFVSPIAPSMVHSRINSSSFKHLLTNSLTRSWFNTVRLLLNDPSFVHKLTCQFLD